MTFEAHMVFLGVMLGRDGMVAPKNRAEAVWANCRPIEKHLATNAIPETGPFDEVERRSGLRLVR